MIESWIVPLAIVGVFAALLFAPLVESLLPRIRRRTFVCPSAGPGETTVEVVERAAFGVAEPPDVRSCSAFPDPAHPTCGKECLAQFQVR